MIIIATFIIFIKIWFYAQNFVFDVQVAGIGGMGGLGDSGNARKKTCFFIDVFPQRFNMEPTSVFF